MGREPQLGCVIGRKGVGKTQTTIKYLRQYVRGDENTPPRKVVIFDNNNEFSDKLKYPDVREISLGDIELFSMHPKIEIRRVAPFIPNSNEEMTPDQKRRAVLYILSHFRNGLVLLEDINAYIDDHVPGDAVGKILAQRHKGIDLILHYQSIGRVQKKIWPHINWLRFHKTNDSVVTNSNKFDDKYECFQIAENIINHQHDIGNIYFYLFINNDYEKIYADVSKEYRDKAIMDFINENHNSKIAPLLNARNDRGGKIYTYGQVRRMVKNRILKTYFENAELDQDDSDDKEPESQIRHQLNKSKSKNKKIEQGTDGEEWRSVEGDETEDDDLNQEDVD